ncbi:MAG: GIY-YIG nuclease family protein [Bdellovibrionales bacterium]|nr:GIY-YIG nuclease family protein [Bdellovibrionales bacterium]
MNAFDRSFGKTKLASLPESPGIYRFYAEDGALIYVGKAKNLRRRVSQYRNARRRKKHAKMRKIVAEATRLEFEVCADEFAALKLENEWIQAHRPKWNVAGAFYFLYPMIGVANADGVLRLCYTTVPERFPEHVFHGAFRSRERTRDAFFALAELLRLIGHPMPRGKRGRATAQPPAPRGSTYDYGFRQIPAEWSARIDGFFRGEDFGAIEELAVLLLDRPTAVARRAETQTLLRTIRLFWRHEAVPLRLARERAGFGAYPVPQRERDRLFIALRAVMAGAPPKDHRPRREKEGARQEVR